MITLFTGVPGTGKTAFVVSLLLEEAKKGRKIYVDGIPDLAVDHHQCGDCKTWQDGTWLRINHYDPTLSDGWRPRDDDASDLGALIVIDEAQRHFRPRPAGSAVPPYIAALETHRKQGLDFWIITQRPGLIDSNIRALVGKHYAIWHHWLGRYLFEWPNVGDIESKLSRDVAAKKRYKLPTHAFDYYKSAEVHTTQKHSKPFVAKALLLILPLMLYLFYSSYAMIKSKFDQNAPAASTAAPVASNGPASPPVTKNAPEVPNFDSSLPPEISSQIPLLPNRPETAPMYAPLRQVKTMPWPSACIASGDRCICYTEQGNRMNDVTSEYCREIVSNGIFNPYRQADAGGAAQPTPGAAGGMLAPRAM